MKGYPWLLLVMLVSVCAAEPRVNGVPQNAKMAGYAALDDVFLFFSRYIQTPESERAVSPRKLLHGLKFCADEYICPFQGKDVAVKIPAMLYIIKKMFNGRQETAVIDSLRQTQGLWKDGFVFQIKETKASVLSDLYSLIALLHEMYVNNLEWLSEGELKKDAGLFLRPATEAGLLMTKVRLGSFTQADVSNFVQSLDPLVQKQEGRGLYRMIVLKILDVRNKLNGLQVSSV